METIITYKILRVKDTSFSINEKVYNHSYTEERTQVRVNCELKHNVKFNYITFEIEPTYFYLHPDGAEDIFASTVVSNVFELSDVSQFVKDEELILPSHLLVTLLGISISHTRALFSRNMEGTVYSRLILPLIDPMAFCRTIFPQMFELDTTEMEE